MPDLIAKETFSYAGRRIKTGASFTASKKDAKVLTLIGRAVYDSDETVPVEKPARKASISRAQKSETQEEKPKRVYKPRPKKTETTETDE